MKTKLVVANWKMNPKSLTEADEIFNGIKGTAGKMRGVHTVIAPPYVYLGELADGYKGKNLSFGAQDVSYELKGSFTGEISIPMLRDSGATYAIVGHSERRALGESNELIHKKVAASLEAKFKTILCIGEQERDPGAEYLAFLKEQLTSALTGIPQSQLSSMIIAYEPVWAIGKSDLEAAKPRDVHEMVIYIRKILVELYDNKVAMKIPVLYGGSVEPENAEALLREGEVNGFLVGHASLDPGEFNAILKIAGSVN